MDSRGDARRKHRDFGRNRQSGRSKRNQRTENRSRIELKNPCLISIAQRGSWKNNRLQSKRCTRVSQLTNDFYKRRTLIGGTRCTLTNQSSKLVRARQHFVNRKRKKKSSFHFKHLLANQCSIANELVMNRLEVFERESFPMTFRTNET